MQLNKQNIKYVSPHKTKTFNECCILLRLHAAINQRFENIKQSEKSINQNFMSWRWRTSVFYIPSHFFSRFCMCECWCCFQIWWIENKSGEVSSSDNKRNFKSRYALEVQSSRIRLWCNKKEIKWRRTKAMSTKASKVVSSPTEAIKNVKDP